MLNITINRKLRYLLFMMIASFALVMTSSTTVPTFKPSFKPSRKPTNQPIHIYGDEDPVFLTDGEKQAIVASLTIALLVLMAFDFTGPEVLFLIALMVCCLTQILTMAETLSGKMYINILYHKK